MPLVPQEQVPLAPRTTLELGGPAAYLAEVESAEGLLEALGWARRRGVPVAVLGGGSNVLVPDAGFDGLVLALQTRGQAVVRDGAQVLLTAQAGEPWDELVAAAVRAGWQGLECLSGIPGRVGATPIQNVGAYGQEVSQAIASVEVLDAGTLERRLVPADACGFAYRDSVFKRPGSPLIVTAVTFSLTPGGAARVAYAELERRLGEGPKDLEAVRQAVLGLRRAKSMVLEAGDPNRRNVGSFFTNPVVSPGAAAEVQRRAARHGLPPVPSWVQADGRVKLAAGFLVEHSGLARGHRVGAVGLSTAHALALVHHGGGTTAELLAFARVVCDRVMAVFGVELEREPQLLRALRAA
jgi:UDP-N-acetylmuramate dehydrogenase